MLVILLHLAQLVCRWRMNLTASAILPQHFPLASIPSFPVAFFLLASQGAGGLGVLRP